MGGRFVPTLAWTFLLKKRGDLNQVTFPFLSLRPLEMLEGGGGLGCGGWMELALVVTFLNRSACGQMHFQEYSSTVSVEADVFVSGFRAEGIEEELANISVPSQLPIVSPTCCCLISFLVFGVVVEEEGLSAVHDDADVSV